MKSSGYFNPILIGLLLVVAAFGLIFAGQTVEAAEAPGGDIGAGPAQAGCHNVWFFGSVAHPVAECPDGPAVAHVFARLEFERGEMIWNQAENRIYVLYRDFQAPYWESFPDTYREGSAERQGGLLGPLGLWQQPRRGFGELWRTNPGVRARLGWALNEWEQSYTGYVQRATTPQGAMVVLTRPDNKAIHLRPGPTGIWEVFSFLG